MRKVIFSMMVSIDGYIESSNPEEEWFNWPEEMNTYMMDFFTSVDTFIFGRKAYEALVEYWPSMSGEFADIMNNTPKLVCSKTLSSVEWNATLIRDNIKEEINKEKNLEGKDIILFGGGGITATFLQLQLVDEFRMIVAPVTLGSGKPLFKCRVDMRMKKALTLECGNVVLFYEPIYTTKP